MIKQVREMMGRTPFIPFVIHTTDGRNISVPTEDHIAVSGQFYVIVTHDDGQWDMIPALHIAGITGAQAVSS
jgi:hypothetical protein